VRALVTGGSAGIGEAFARALATQGTALVLVARRLEPLERLAAELRSRHDVQVELLPADLTDKTDLAQVENRLEEQERRIDLLVNNAGSETEHAAFAERDRELLAAEVQLNVLALLRLTHAASAAMASQGGGHVINVSSGNAFYPTPGAAAYGASKAFVNSLTEALIHELRDSGVTVTAVCPGFTKTGAQRRLGLNSDLVPRFLWHQPDEVAAAALKAAAQGKVVSSLDASGAVAAFAGRHLPRRLLVPLVARASAKLASSSSATRRRPIFPDDDRATKHKANARARPRDLLPSAQTGTRAAPRSGPCRLLWPPQGWRGHRLGGRRIEGTGRR
jgi:short-subunit dehydrogenase